MICFLGDVSKIQYTFNNTDPDGYWPVPCKVDFPEKIGENQWVINHCPNIVSFKNACDQANSFSKGSVPL